MYQVLAGKLIHGHSCNYPLRIKYYTYKHFHVSVRDTASFQFSSAVSIQVTVVPWVTISHCTHLYYRPGSIKQVILCGSSSAIVWIVIFSSFQWTAFHVWKSTYKNHRWQALLESSCFCLKSSSKKNPKGPSLSYNIVFSFNVSTQLLI